MYRSGRHGADLGPEGSKGINDAFGIIIKMNNEEEEISLSIGINILSYHNPKEVIILEYSQIIIELMIKDKMTSNMALNHHLCKARR